MTIHDTQKHYYHAKPVLHVNTLNFNFVFFLFQVAASFEQLMEDFETLRQWERDGSIYKLQKRSDQNITQGNYQK